MTAICTYLDDRDETLIAYLYDDIDAATRTAFEAHVSSCAACRAELDGLRRVRRQLAAWVEPVDSRHSTVNAVDRQRYPRLSALESRPSTVDSRKTSWLPDVPAWAQVAAAILIVGVAAGIANLDIRYDANGLSIRTGWSTPSAAATRTDNAANTVANTVTRAELVALEQRLRDEVRTLQAGAHAVAVSDAHPARASADGDLMRRVRTMLDEGEKRQQRELALRVGEVLRDVSAQRQADLVRIDRSLGLVENNLGVEVLKQRERVNYLMRVNQRQ
jgi:anti-sigma factor RsiW